MIRKHYKDLKSITKNRHHPDMYFPARYSFSTCRGCQHACSYCDGRAEKYYVDGTFDTDIVIRKNIPALLRKQIPTLKEKAPFLIGSGVSDVYQPFEQDERLMPEILRTIIDSGYPASVLTKSSMISRDIDLWKELNDKNGAYVMLSWTMLNDELRQIFEPNTASVKQRIEVVKTFKSKGIPVGILAMPFYPLLTDSYEQVSKFVNYVKSLGVDFISPGGMTLRPGRQKEHYLKVLKEHFPEKVDRLKEIYAENKQSGAPNRKYSEWAHLQISKAYSESNIVTFLPHKVFRRFFPIYDTIYLLLNHMRYMYKYKEINTSKLDTAFKSYAAWLKLARKGLSSQRSLDQRYLEQRFYDEIILNNNLLDSIDNTRVIDNDKLIDFIKNIVENDMIFDYAKMELIKE